MDRKNYLYLLHRISQSSVHFRIEQTTLTNAHPNILLRHSVEYLGSRTPPEFLEKTEESYRLVKILGKTRASWTI